MAEETRNKILLKKSTPPKKKSKSIQMDLFGQFLSNGEHDVSNTIENWDSIPKYFFTTKLVEKLRNADGFAEPYTWTFPFKYPDRTVVERSITIKPALIQQKDGSYKAFFPSSSEEILEEVFKKLLAERNTGYHDVEKCESWVMFSISRIEKILASVGRTKDRNQIKHSIEVMSNCIAEIKEGDNLIYRGAILADLTSVSRKEYENNPDKRWIARLPVLISMSINSLSFRQYNSDRLFKLRDQLSRWMHQRLVRKYKQAAIDNDFDIMYSTIEKESALLQISEVAGRKKVIRALEELLESQVIYQYKVEPIENKTTGKILDVKYILNPSYDFIKEQKASNKRNLMIQEQAAQANLELT